MRRGGGVIAPAIRDARDKGPKTIMEVMHDIAAHMCTGRLRGLVRHRARPAIHGYKALVAADADTSLIKRVDVSKRRGDSQRLDRQYLYLYWNRRRSKLAENRERAIIWLYDSKKQLMTFPQEVRTQVGYALSEAQMAGRLTTASR